MLHGSMAKSGSRDRMPPDLDDDFEPTRACREEFRRCGHTRVNGLASPEEVAAYRPALLEAGPKGRYDHRPLEERDTYGKAFVQMSNLWRHGDAARVFVFAAPQVAQWPSS